MADFLVQLQELAGAYPAWLVAAVAAAVVTLVLFLIGKSIRMFVIAAIVGLVVAIVWILLERIGPISPVRGPEVKWAPDDANSGK